ncbi:hypothetical protein [Agrobacterium sp. DE0009]|uniref:hypothetical protein n=1 Tax=Agrobacterium sp. DE0009 TaxID=2587505 RepID=UPI001643D4BD|nr:hypothetical protein [Agrobacterium sp. DE0009]
MDLRENFTCMKNCLSNVAEIARNHDIFSPIDERISNPVQAVSDFYTAFSGNAGKPLIAVENSRDFTKSSFPEPADELESSCMSSRQGCRISPLVKSWPAPRLVIPRAMKERLLS